MYVRLFVWLLIGMHECVNFNPIFSQSVRLIGTLHVLASASTSSEHNACAC